MERLALPVAGTRISPLFDVARSLILADIEDGRVTNRAQHEVGDESPQARVRLLAVLGTGILVCGGISRPLAMMVEAQGIRVTPWVMGEVDAVLAAYIDGRLATPGFTMPGCRRGGCRRRGRGGRGRWRGRFS